MLHCLTGDGGLLTNIFYRGPSDCPFQVYVHGMDIIHVVQATNSSCWVSTLSVPAPSITSTRSYQACLTPPPPATCTLPYVAPLSSLHPTPLTQFAFLLFVSVQFILVRTAAMKLNAGWKSFHSHCILSRFNAQVRSGWVTRRCTASPHVMVGQMLWAVMQIQC